MKTTMFRNVIATSLLGALMALAVPLNAQPRDRDDDRDHARYYTRDDDYRRHDDFRRDRDDRFRDRDDYRHDRRWRDDDRRDRDRDRDRDSLRFFFQVNPRR